jgi:ribosomal protein S18 acetylase RimI-like enzyme
MKGNMQIMNYSIRQIKETEYAVLDNFLYEAIFLPEGVTPPPKEIIEQPELQVYVKDFGQLPDDHCLVAEADGKVIGAVWVRIMDDYGHVDEHTPSFAISLYPEYRGLGIGTALMRHMLLRLKSCGYRQASLAVQKANYAVKMYRKVGFVIVDENEEEYIMTVDLGKREEIPLGKLVTVTVDRPLGSFHPEYKDMYYHVNYGYIAGIIAPDGEEQDAYILGVNEPVKEFTGRIIAIIRRSDDVEEKWVVAPDGVTFTKDEIMEAVRFQEQYFQSEMIMNKER